MKYSTLLLQEKKSYNFKSVWEVWFLYRSQDWGFSCFFFYVKNPGNSYSSRLNLMHLDYLLQTLEWGLRIRIFKISWDNITTTAMVYHWVSYERQLCLVTYRVKFYFTFSEWWLIYGQGGHKHRRKRTRGNSHKLPELSLTGKLGKAKVSGDQNCVNGSHFFLGLIYEKLYILACYFKE